MLFHAKVNWWNEYDNEDVIDHVVVLADSWNDATNRINLSFDCINSIDIEVINEDAQLLFINESSIHEIKELNSF